MEEPQHSWERDRHTRKQQLGRWSLVGKEAEVGRLWDAIPLWVPLARKLASLNYGELLYTHSTHSWGGAKKRAGLLSFALPWWFETELIGSVPSLKQRLVHLASCCWESGWQLEKLALGW